VTLRGKHVLVTAGPTHEPIDPVRVIANRSSGRQGFAIAAAAADAGARVTLVAGPVSLDTPVGVCRIDVETAEQMADAVFAALPADVAILDYSSLRFEWALTGKPVLFFVQLDTAIERPVEFDIRRRFPAADAQVGRGTLHMRAATAQHPLLSRQSGTEPVGPTTPSPADGSPH